MNIFIQHIILAARNRDGNDWMNILFLVFVLILYVVSGLVKKIKDHRITFGEEKESRQTPRPANVSKKPVGIKPYPADFKRPGVTSDKWQTWKASAKAFVQRAVTYEPDMYKGPKVDEIEETVSELETKVKLADTMAVEETKVEREVLGDFVTLDEPIDFREAFIHYEIFGKPLSLRKELGPIGLNP